jgi:hypothetical protein
MTTSLADEQHQQGLPEGFSLLGINTLFRKVGWRLPDAALRNNMAFQIDDCYQSAMVRMDMALVGIGCWAVL